MNEKNFVVSVCDAIGKDATTKEILFVGKTLINSALKETIQSKEITGGFGAGFQYEFSYGKKLECDIEDCKFEPTFLALNNGVLITSETNNYFSHNEVVTLTSGTGALAQTPIGKIYVEMPDGTNQIVDTSNAKPITIGSDTIDIVCTYQYSTTVDTISIDSDKYPSSIELTLISKVFNANGQSKELQIFIPKYKISGSMDLSFTEDGVSSSKLSGKALATNTNNYAKIMMKTLGSNSVPVTQIACTTAEVTLANAATETLEVIGIRGGVYGNVLMSNADLTFTSSAVGVATVGEHTGLITWIGAGDTIITIKLTSDDIILDIVNVTCNA